jgi:hypothetical protein
MKHFGLPIVFGLCGSLALGCFAPSGAPDPEPASADEPFTSDVATLMSFEFDGELTSSSATNLSGQIRTQLLYTVGQLNAGRSVSRLSKLSLSNVSSAYVGSGLYRVRYHAKLPVAWGSKTNLPSSYTFKLPKRVDSAGISAFTAAYAASCQDADGHSVTASNFWFHYRPDASGCALAPADVVSRVASATKSSQNTTGKYPEYHRVWEDRMLRVVAVFGKYESGATSPADAGIAAYDEFAGAVRAQWPGAATTPASLPAHVGAAQPEVTFEAELGGGRSLVVTAMLVNELRSEGAAFDKRYAELTPGADLILYNGHAGLGANVAALATKGAWFPGKYQILFVNGCDTFAYQDDTLAKTRAALNADDPSGTKYMDVLTNAMPAYFSSLPDASMALLRGLTASTPVPYTTMFRDIDASQVVVATGEEDNVYGPAQGGLSGSVVFELSGTVAYKQVMSWQTPVLAAGKYAFEMTPEPSAPGGDADLRVRAGVMPDGTQTYKCPSYKYNSNERCVLTLSSASTVYVTATGDKSSQVSSFLVRAFRL